MGGDQINIVFWALILIGAAILWMTLSSYFWGIGDLFSELWGGAKEAMNETEIEEENIENEQ